MGNASKINSAKAVCPFGFMAKTNSVKTNKSSAGVMVMEREFPQMKEFRSIGGSSKNVAEIKHSVSIRKESNQNVTPGMVDAAQAAFSNFLDGSADENSIC